MKPMPDDMKEDLRKRRENESIREKIHTQQSVDLTEREDVDTYSLPEGYTGSQWKKALKIIKGRNLKKRKKK